MKRSGKFFGTTLAVVIFFIAAAGNRAQQIPLGHATGFNSDIYFEPPDDAKVKMKLSGAEAAPLPGGLMDVKQLRVELFSTNGSTRMVAVAPRCTVAPLGATADSPGHMELRSGDGKFFTEGDGFRFVWQQDATSLSLSNHTSLSLSNHVHTVMLNGILKP